MSTLPVFVSDALREPREHAFAERLGRSNWSYTSSTQMSARASNLARALAAQGIGAGDRVGLMANNCVDWLAVDFGILYGGCVVVPIFATLALDQVDYILRDCAAKLVFVETGDDIARLRAGCPSAPRLVAMRGSGSDSLAAFEEAGSGMADVTPAAFAHPPECDDLAVLIYTSGTTGNPKGVILSHANLVSNATAAAEYVLRGTIERGDAAMTVLPFAHIYEYTNLSCYLYFGCDISVTLPDHLLEDLRAVRPRVMAFVPRIFERLLGAIVAKARAKGGPTARLVPWALDAGRVYQTAIAAGEQPGLFVTLRFAIARKLVLSKIARAMGLDRMKFISSGSAPLHRDIALTFAAMGVRICEGYGLTETSPVVTATRLREIRYGSVGKPLPALDVKIAADGEILVKGPSVMTGYYNLPGEHPFTSEGYFTTGDVGCFDDDGYLYITDRKKELIKTSAGKYIAPGRVEAALKRSIYIGQCFVIGDGRPFPMALIAPNWALVRGHIGVAADVTTAALSLRADVRDFILKEVVARSADLASFEAIRRVALLPRDLTIEDGELSPTLKIKRRVVEKRHAALIESAYTEATPV